MTNSIIVQQVASYVTELLNWQLSPDLKFHNKKHTEEVVAAVTRIAQTSDLHAQELETLQIAAWFHDTGYCYRYTGHEDDSIAIAEKYLRYLNCTAELISQVKDIIAATQMPQKPANRLQQIMCDADLAHLASEQYNVYAMRLREEWLVYTGKSYTEKEWNALSIDFLENHRFFTEYGQTVFEEKKQKNLQKLLNGM